MKRLLGFLVLALALLPAGLRAQDQREVRFSPSARAYLVAQWDSLHANQPERAYCLVVVPAQDALPGDTIDVVVGVFRAVARFANPVQVSFNCGPTMRTLHVHPPTTCAVVVQLPDPLYPGQFGVAVCQLGGWGNGLCYPSEPDLAMIDKFKQPWGLIQCAPDAFVTFYRGRSGGLYP